MPLFAFISGYFSVKAIKNMAFVHLLKIKGEKLLLPIISFVIVYFFLFGFPDNLNLAGKIAEIIYVFLWKLWFLWGIFISTITVYLLERKHFSKYLFPFLMVTFFIIPNCGTLSWMVSIIPAFVTGYYFNKFDYMNYLYNHSFLSVIILFVSFSLLLLFFTKDCYIYTSGLSCLGNAPLTQILIDVYRLVIGIVGSLFFITLTYMVKLHLRLGVCEKFLSYIGKYSLGMYIYQTIIFDFIEKELHYQLLPCACFLVINLIIICCSTIFLTFITSKNRIFSFFILGGRR